MDKIKNHDLRFFYDYKLKSSVIEVVNNINIAFKSDMENKRFNNSHSDLENMPSRRTDVQFRKIC